MQSNTLFGAVGYLKEVGCAGDYAQVAYDFLLEKGIIDDHEFEGEEWTDVMIADNGAIYAVYGDISGTGIGTFKFAEISNGTSGDGETLERIGRIIAKYNVFYSNIAYNRSVNYSIRFIKIGDFMYVYNTKDGGTAYISDMAELSEYKESKDLPEGFWE